MTEPTDAEIDAAPAQPGAAYAELPDFDTVEQRIYAGCRRFISGDMLEPIHGLIREAIDADRASRGKAPAPTAPSAQGDASPTMPKDIEMMATNRYRPVPSGMLAYKVVGGDGNRSLFSGTKDECQIVARKLTEAFLDGAHVALSTQPAAPAAQGDALDRRESGPTA